VLFVGIMMLEISKMSVGLLFIGIYWYTCMYSVSQKNDTMSLL